MDGSKGTFSKIAYSAKLWWIVGGSVEIMVLWALVGLVCGWGWLFRKGFFVIAGGPRPASTETKYFLMCLLVFIFRLTIYGFNNQFYTP